jgi:hypothetical protein
VLYNGILAQENTQLSLQRGLVSVVLYWLDNLMTVPASVSFFLLILASSRSTCNCQPSGLTNSLFSGTCFHHFVHVTRFAPPAYATILQLVSCYIMPTECIDVFCTDIRTNSQLFPCTELTDWFFKLKNAVFSARFELSF